MNFGTVAILGPGLIGGSLALALAERSLADRLVIYARSAHALDAIRLAGVDAELTGNPSDALVTDVGSVKGSIDAALAPLLKDRALWIGSHPMAGSEQSGFVAARADLFEGAAVILTPTAQTKPEAQERAEKFWRALGGRLFILSPADHDMAVADISHVPHLLAALLVANANPKSLPLAAGGFRDTTRIASGSAELWTEILWANRDALARNCHAWAEQLAQVQRLFASGDEAAKSELFKLLENAQSVRSQLMDKKPFSPHSATFRP